MRQVLYDDAAVTVKGGGVYQPDSVSRDQSGHGSSLSSRSLMVYHEADQMAHFISCMAMVHCACIRIMGDRFRQFHGNIIVAILG